MAETTERGITIGLTDAELEVVRSVVALFPEVRKAILFGSRAKGIAQRYADVDLALQGDNLRNVVSRIHDLLEEETNLPYFFDVLDYAKINNEDLRAHIDRVGVIVFERT